ncbi:MAG: hypothetical protein V1667_02180 [bacterium]
MQIGKVKEIKKINAISFANAAALMYGFVGFFASFVLAVSVIAFLIANENSGGSIILITLFNIGAGLLLGILSFAFTASIGWIMGYAAAGIYNWFAKRSGGIKIELADFIDAPEISNQDNIVKIEDNL